jgi:hypothetical protein
MEVWELLSWLEDCWQDGSWGPLDTPPSGRPFWYRMRLGNEKSIVLKVKQ